MTRFVRRLLRLRSPNSETPADLELRAEALRVLAALLAVGLAPRAALAAWHESAPGAVRPALKRLARRLELGASLRASLLEMRSVLGDDAVALSMMLDVLMRVGGRPPDMVEALATSVRARAGFLSQARAAASGAVLSGRLIAMLPLAFIPLASVARGPFFDAPGMAVLFAGGALAVMGMAWISRLLPVAPRSDDPAASLADLVKAALSGGAHYATALDCIARHAPLPLGDELRRAQRWVRLGSTWPDALERAGSAGLEGLAGSLRRAQELGLPAATSLETWARARRVEVAHAFDAATRRAAVLMMIPLATCILPSFILLAVVPFLRGLSWQ